MAKVSVIIPTYNRAHFVGDAIRSALVQDLDDVEIVVIDDGSTDPTRDVIMKFADKRIKYVYQKNRGATAAFNRGVTESTGEYIGILGSDDYYQPGGLAPLVSELDKKPELGAVSGGFDYVRDDGRRIQEHRSWEMYASLDTLTWLYTCPMFLQSSLIRRSWIQRVGGFDENIICAQDSDFWLRLSFAGCPMGFVPSTVFCYRLHATQSVRNLVTLRNDWLRILDNFYSNDQLPQDLLRVKNDVYANVYLNSAIRAFDVNQVEDGAGDIGRAIELAPHLLNARGQSIFERILGWTEEPFVSDPDRFLRVAFTNLPKAASVVKDRKREALALLNMSRFYRAYGNDDWSTARRAFALAAIADTSWLLNRGAVVMWCRSMAGTCELVALYSFFKRLIRSNVSFRGPRNGAEVQP